MLGEVFIVLMSNAIKVTIRLQVDVFPMLFQTLYDNYAVMRIINGVGSDNVGDCKVGSWQLNFNT